MKVCTLLMILGMLQVSASSTAQKVTLNDNHTPLGQVFDQIRSQTGYDFAYTNSTLNDAQTVTIHVNQKELKEVLDELFAGQELEYTIQDKSILVKTKQPGLLDKIKSYLQSIDVHGRVVDDSGLPLSGATIAVKGSSNVTSTDANGYFALHNVAPDATLVITYIGFDKQELKAASEMGTIKMIVTESKLDQVQIIAYGETTQRLTTGNIATVSAKEIEQQPVSNPLLALEGKVPGLSITQATGVSGSGVTVRIQGQNSIFYGNDPLYVVDGVPYVSETLPTTTGGNAAYNIEGHSGALVNAGGGSPFNYLNSNDIENIEILKGADATSIYGSRAANGAILVTTKRGKGGETKAEFNVKTGWEQVTRMLDLMNTQQYLAMRHEAINNDGLSVTAATNYDLRQWDTTRYTNWEKTLIGGTARYNDYNGSVSGGSATTNYLISGTYHNETTVFPGNFGDSRGAVHLNLNSASSNQRFKLTFNANYLADNNTQPNIDFTNAAITLAPDSPPLYNADGSLNWAPNASGSNTWQNPLSYELATFQSKTNNLISSATMKYQIIKGLDVSINLGYNNLNITEFMPMPIAYYAPAVQPLVQRTANYTNSTVQTWIAEPQLNYSRTIGKGKLSVLFGGTFQSTSSSGTNQTGTGYFSDAVLQDIHSASTITVNSSIASLYRYNAVFSRVNYSWDEKYILNITSRDDGSSRFGAANQTHFFGSVGAGWIFTDENAIRKNLGFLSFGKLRGSYGTTGNDQIGDYQYLNLYTPVTYGNPYQSSVSLSPNRLPNQYLQWEETKKLEFGMDLGLFKDRILLTVNYSYNRSSNELLNYSLPIVTGFSSVLENFPATIQNKDWEFALTSNNVKSKDFNWTTAFNLTLPQNKLVSFPNIAQSTYASGTNGVIVGQPIGIIKAFQFLGVNSQTGVYQFLNSQGQITSNPNPATDKTQLVNLLPKFYGGLNNTFKYKGLSLSVFLQFVKQLGSNDVFGQSQPGFRYVNEPVNLLTRWTTPGQQTSIQRFNSSQSLYTQYADATQSDAAFTDASFIRLKNLELSYQFNDHLTKRWGLSNLRLFVQGQNLLTITKFAGLDPENQSLQNLPPLRVLAIGLQTSL